jgi:hypothetical protein
VRCFNHQDREAVGACKACSKGLCAECAADLGHGLACRGSHESAVEALNQITLRARRVQATSTKARYVAPTFHTAMGLLFLGWGLFSGPRFTFLSLLGGAFLIYAFVIFVTNQRAYSPAKPDA